MAKMNVRASTYRVARGKAEIAREAKWQKTAKLATKKRLEMKKNGPADKVIEGPESSGQGKTPEPIKPTAPDNKKGQ
jgi:hypothetical protein